MQPTWSKQAGTLNVTESQLSLRFLPDSPYCGQPDLEIFRGEFLDHAGQIQADPRFVGDVSHGPRLVDSCHARSEPPGLDAGSERAHHRCTPRAEGDPRGSLPARINSLPPREDLNGPVSRSLSLPGAPVLH